MERKAVSGIMLTLLLVSVFMLASGIQQVRASGTIYIRADGSIDPPTAPIQRDGDVYTFTDNIYESIVVERDNIVVDGAGKTVQGTEEFDSRGMDLSNRVNVTVRNTRITAFYYGVYLNYSSNNSITGNNITANNTFCIWLDSSSNYNSISGNNITNSWFGIDLYSSSNNNISENNITNNVAGIWLVSSSNNNISENSITNNTDGINLYYSSNNNISGNTLLNNGLMVWDSCGNLVTGNLVNGKPLVYLEGVSDYSVENAGQVVLVNCINIQVENLNLSNASYGVDLWSTTNTIISGNNIANNVAGISLAYGSHNVISGNNITANYGDGIYLAYSSSNSIVGNNITANNYGGFYLWYSSDNSIVGNDITNNRCYGIQFYYSSNNRFWHNNFIDNPQQAFVETAGYANVWDDGYPSGGNYWSDYVGVDVKSGPHQDLPGSDGIGDAPYIIGPYNVDHYPLMNPYGAPPPPAYALTITTTVDGTTTPTPGIYSYTSNSSVQVIAIPNTDYLFDHWELDTVNVGSAKTYTVTMDKNHTLKAIFSHVKPSVPVGGYSFPIRVQTTTNPSNIYVVTIAILTAVFTIFKRKASNKQQRKKDENLTK